jgi:hypothetical protein
MAYEDWTFPAHLRAPSARSDALPVEAAISGDELYAFGDLLGHGWTWPQIEQAFAIVHDLETWGRQRAGSDIDIFEDREAADLRIRTVGEIAAAAHRLAILRSSAQAGLNYRGQGGRARIAPAVANHG